MFAWWLVVDINFDPPRPASEIMRLYEHVLGPCVERWATDGFLPRSGLFVERFNMAGAPLVAVPTRCMVQARQLFSLCLAARLRGDDMWLATAAQGAHALRRLFMRDDGKDGCVFSVHPDGSTHDRTRDTYAHAFVVLCLAEAWRALREPWMLGALDNILDFLNSALSDQRRGCFVMSDSVEGRQARSQNPHMHLLEGLLAATEAVGNERYLEMAADIVDAFEGVMFRHREAILPEHFDSSWEARRDAGFIRWEPGHHFEWAWLLDWYARLARRPRSATASVLFNQATRLGWVRERGVVDEILGEKLTSPTYRLWPQTECIKAAACLGDVELASELASDAVSVLYGLMLSPAPPGCWHDRLDSVGNPNSSFIPASSLYHLTMAASELPRLEARLYAIADGPESLA